MQVKDLFRFKSPEIRALHLTWIAFFLTFYVWFNMAPLATSMLKAEGSWLTQKDIKLFMIANVALTIPARVIIGMLLDRFGPRRVFSALMVVMTVPVFVFALGESREQLLVSRLLLSSVGAGFVVGIHMTSLWFPPKHIGFAEGFYAGWGNFGSAAAAITIPTIALQVFGGDDGWRYAMMVSGAIMFFYGIFYWFAITDGPKPGTQRKPRNPLALEVSSYKDLWLLIAFTVPMFGVLSILVWRVHGMGFLDTTGAILAYGAIVAVIIYQVIQTLRVNLPILRKGVPEDDKYPFSTAASLNVTYFANFGAELAVVSMLPMFFELTWGLTAAAAGIIASSFAFVNLFARPLGGILSDMFGSRRMVMMTYMFGIGVGFALMGLLDSDWPLFIAIVFTISCSIFVQGAEGATFGIIPAVKRRLTGQIAGMAGAYGNVGAVFYLFVLSSPGMTYQMFFFIISGGAFFAWLFCLIWLKEPEGAFNSEYHISSVDREIEAEHEAREAAANKG
ncbi:MAG TPA: MFS transporter [Rhodobacteraceae bacterium]|jgi:NNP family nitrate/nitrite transporter-like MFS transporter|nr:MFS transporter [Paracoccaceae bacterium]